MANANAKAVPDASASFFKPMRLSNRVVENGVNACVPCASCEKANATCFDVKINATASIAIASGRCDRLPRNRDVEFWPSIGENHAKAFATVSVSEAVVRRYPSTCCNHRTIAGAVSVCACRPTNMPM